MHGMGKGTRARLWLAAAVLAIGIMIPWLVTISLA
jgi:hypothetical protein